MADGKSVAQRRRVKFERQGGACHWCGRQMTMRRNVDGTMPKNFATLEHVVRRADGGAGLPNNVVLACQACNNQRGAGTPSQLATGWAW